MIKELTNQLVKMEETAFDLMLNKKANNKKTDSYIDYFG
ncbi:hypothetical protein C8C77_1291 [Halanaerobium saccharolyticum]|uniref:Uncharacterized protein n=1 Tax=Halanaerobium saccharolyticum TaxID=43595 RepID=A0A4V3G4B7_9FIRM|nr:hypothetical protein C7958_1261 [Halanaerobium saccharolyticum]TDV99757.1 hypothetical protein C8C77_1291 [Halanaerobium saccharolyticum]TDX51979.1 hypothetical protein C7956_1281 [Halanaerobium saccharolyticum]